MSIVQSSSTIADVDLSSLDNDVSFLKVLAPERTWTVAVVKQKDRSLPPFLPGTMRARTFRPRTVVVIVLVALILFVSAPFLTLLLGNSLRDHVFREICYRIVFDKITVDCEDDRCVALKVFEFASAEIAIPEQHEVLMDLSPMEIIADGYGWCDQQANVMITLAGLGGINGDLLFLFGYDSLSHHSVCELEVDGKYRLFDPFYHASFRTSTGQLAGLNDLLQGDNAPDPITGTVPEDYFRLFENAYPPQIYLSNRVPAFKQFSRWLIRLYCRAPTRFLIKPYVGAYAVMDAPSTVNMEGVERLVAM